MGCLLKEVSFILYLNFRECLLGGVYYNGSLLQRVSFEDVSSIWVFYKGLSVIWVSYIGVTDIEVFYRGFDLGVTIIGDVN